MTEANRQSSNDGNFVTDCPRAGGDPSPPDGQAACQTLKDRLGSRLRGINRSLENVRGRRSRRSGVIAVLLAGALAAGCAAPIVADASVAPDDVCRVPVRITPAPAYDPPADEVVADAPTAFYMLALTWAPEACRTKGDDPAFATQCRANSFGFILHGLWPNGPERRHPRYCGPAPAIRAATVRRHLCMIPSAQSLQHEWAAHGTCGWASSEAYFRRSSILWRALKLPPMAATMTAGEIREAFVKANPAHSRDGVYLKVTDGRLEDVRLCYDLRYRPAACPGGVGPADETTARVLPRRPR